MTNVEKDVDLLAAALLYSQGYSQNDIAEELGKNQPNISKLLKQAKAEGLLTHQFNGETLSPEVLQAVNARTSHGALNNKLQALAPNAVDGPYVRVFPSGSRLTTPEKWDDRITRFGFAAGDYAMELMSRATVVGVSWGRTITGLILGMEKFLLKPSRTKTDLVFVPVCGEPLGYAEALNSSSRLAGKLGYLMNGPRNKTLSLTAVPAFIPQDFGKRESDVMYKLFHRIEAYNKIFQSTDSVGHPHTPLIERLDALITGVGQDNPLGYLHDELIRTSGVSEMDLRNLVLGDISGILIRKPELRESAKKKVMDINNRWTGIKRLHLEQCAKRGSKDGPPGVIVVAIGRNKAEFVYQAIKEGLINHLLIDQDLANALKDIP